jgi:hypothetical protein
MATDRAGYLLLSQRFRKKFLWQLRQGYCQLGEFVDGFTAEGNC